MIECSKSKFYIKLKVKQNKSYYNCEDKNLLVCLSTLSREEEEKLYIFCE